MVAFKLPELSERLLPRDWYATSFWRDTAASLASPLIGAASTEALRTIFDDDWVRSIPDARHDPHPLEYWYALGGGVPRLLRLGFCLSELGGVPNNIRTRLRRVSDFDAAEAEVRAASLFHGAGASIEWIETDRQRTPEFFAQWGPHRVPVEVKQLGDGKRDAELGAIDHAFQRGLQNGLKSSLNGGNTEASSVAVLAAVVDELAPLLDLDDLDAAALAAEKLGAEYGHAWGNAHCAQSPGGPPQGPRGSRPALRGQSLRRCRTGARAASLDHTARVRPRAGAADHPRQRACATAMTLCDMKSTAASKCRGRTPM